MHPRDLLVGRAGNVRSFFAPYREGPSLPRIHAEGGGRRPTRAAIAAAPRPGPQIKRNRPDPRQTNRDAGQASLIRRFSAGSAGTRQVSAGSRCRTIRS